ncbi:hypothetical protein ANAEL_02110 [Anaerolineales bacterium]|nr:hypothetical protein ANAEL_02110 [Anaerolineales bacterium]
MKRILLPVLLTLSLVLAACSASSTPPPSSAAQDNPQPASVSDITPTPTDDPAILATLFPNMGGNSEMTRSDQQGAIIMEITPINLGVPADTLEFEVVLTTHSIDLSMDLATLSTLTTDTGVSVESTLWDAPRGGHHVEGKLIFPATKDDKSVLEGATKLTLTIINVDTPTRIFEWELK